jgi:hypothetical protein
MRDAASVLSGSVVSAMAGCQGIRKRTAAPIVDRTVEDAAETAINLQIRAFRA